MPLYIVSVDRTGFDDASDFGGQQDVRVVSAWTSEATGDEFRLIEAAEAHYTRGGRSRSTRILYL